MTFPLASYPPEIIVIFLLLVEEVFNRTMKNTAINTESLTKRYGSIIAVDHLTMTVPEGIVFGFLGPNGAGKTTTIRLLLGLAHPEEGTSRVFGLHSIFQGDKVRSLCGALLENHGLYERLSALDNLKYYADIYQLPPDQKLKRIESLLKFVDLWDRRGEKIKDWSRGMKQKLALVRAMLHHPRLLFLDEPTLGLDVHTARKIRDTIVDLSHREQCTTFLTSHNLAEVEQVCQRVAIIHKGKLMAQGTPDELKTQGGYREVSFTGMGFSPEIIAALEKIPTVHSLVSSSLDKDKSKRTTITVRMKNHDPLNPVMERLLKEGITIENIETKTQSLENVFLELTNEEEGQERI